MTDRLINELALIDRIERALERLTCSLKILLLGKVGSISTLATLYEANKS